jgi:predicted glycosyltransferase
MPYASVKKILIYSQDGLGLGHLRRNLNLCEQIKKRGANVSCLIIADSPVAPFFKMPAHCDFVKIPTIVKVDTGVWKSNRLPVEYTELLAMRAEIIQNVMLSFRPHVFVVDHMPHGALGELARPLEVLKKCCPHTKVILGLRDILGAPEVIHQQWQKEGAFAAAENFYDVINIYGSAGLFNAIAEYHFPPALLGKTRYCGYVCRENADAARAEKKTNGGGKFILVTGGGGADAAFFMAQFVAAARQLRRDTRFQALITTGPFMPEEQCARLRQEVKDLPLAVSQAGEDSIRYLRQADLVISMAGYNTVSEIMHFRKNAIVVPRPGPSAEQTMRTRLMSGRGLFSTIHPRDLTAENLAELIKQKLCNGHTMNDAMLPDLNGASKAATNILTA